MNTETEPKITLYVLFVCVMGALFYTYEYLLRIEPSVMAPQLLRQFHITSAGLGILSSMYYLAYTPLQAFVGMITDRYPIRYIFVFAVLCCTLGSFVFGMASYVYIAGVGRFLMGLGSAFAFVGALKIAATWLPANRFAMFAGIVTSIGMIGAMFSDVSVGWMVVKYGWRAVILLGAFVGVLLVPVFYFFVRKNPAYVDQTNQDSFAEIWRQLLKIICMPQILCAGVIGGFLYLSISVFAELWGIPFLQTKAGGVHPDIAKLNALVFLGFLLGGPFWGWFSDQIRSRRAPMILGGVCAAFSISFIILFPNSSEFVLSAILFAFGFFSSAEIIVFGVCRDLVPVSLSATAVGVVNLLIMLMGMIMQPAVGILLNYWWNGQRLNGIPQYSTASYDMALLVLPAAMLLAAIIAIFMKDSYPHAGSK